MNQIPLDDELQTVGTRYAGNFDIQVKKRYISGKLGDMDIASNWLICMTFTQATAFVLSILTPSVLPL